MDRTVELGRAVVSPTATNLELWLTTLITLSPRHPSIDLQQVSPASLIKFLSSGESWVERGNGMHLVFEITSRGEPLANAELRALTEGIVNAPAWKQLNLQPSLPLNLQSQPGRVQINLAQLRGDTDTANRKGHRKSASIPLVDAKPPEGLPIFCLHSVNFALVFSENRAKTTSIRQKLRKSQSASATRSPGIASFFRPSDGTLDVPLSEITETVDCSKDEDLFATEQARPPAQGRKRKRPLTLPSKRCASDFLALAEPDRQNTQKQPHTITAVPIVSGETPGAPEFQMVQDMVDAAVRISVLTNLKGSTSGLKIKASTFAGGLADIAPALWRLGYLAAITQRAHLITSLSLSFSRTSSRAKSEALQAKTAELVNPPYVEAVYPPRIDFVTGFDINVVTSTVANRVWIYAQKNILSRPTSGFIQSFCMPTIQDLTPAAYDEIPEEGGEGSHSHITPTPATLTAENIGEQSSAELYAKSIGSGDDDEMLFPAEQGLHTSTARSLCIQHLVDPVAAPRTPGQSDLDPVSRYNGLSDDSGIRTVGKNSGEEDGSFTKNDILGANACFYSGGPCDGKLPEARERVESIGILYF